MPRCTNPRCKANNPAGIRRCDTCRCFLPDTIIAGRYRIEKLIGKGGMGEVYQASDTFDRLPISDTFEAQPVALKILTYTPKIGMSMEEAATRFKREAQFGHLLSHKNIVPVLNFGVDGRLFYLTMPLITGGTLKQLLQSEKPLSTAVARAFLNDLAEAIDAIHAHPMRIVHRDIKPSNLLIHQDDGRLVVTDFGIAKALQYDKPLTGRGSDGRPIGLGTQNYIAPEQADGKPEPASDIYAMGVVAYQMFTGLLPVAAYFRNAAQSSSPRNLPLSIPLPGSLNPALPSAIDAVIMRAIETDPARRYPSGRAFADAINETLDKGDVWLMPTITIQPRSSSLAANVIKRTITMEHPCFWCGQENRRTSRFCRYCGHKLEDTVPVVSDVCQVGHVSDEGQQAHENEDMLLILQGLCVSFLPPRPFSLLAVADGLRGPEGRTVGGHEASRLAVDTLADMLLPRLTTRSHSHRLLAHTSPNGHLEPDTIIERWIRDAIYQANRVIYHCNEDFGTQMASTLATVLLYKHRLYIGSVGDSRIYHFRAGQDLRCLTHPQAPVQAPSATRTTTTPHNTPASQRYLGQQTGTSIDLFQYPVSPEDLVLLCTDGLWHMLTSEQIEELLASGGDVEGLAQNLMRAANQAGGEGNISAIVVRVL
ncbi:MAG: protein kinase [Ktedonobacteraceae bacterium]|nr:protein kinase [Ktedonobacteraceae bacterium]